MTPAIKLERILLATDFLESSRLALDYAIAFAQHFKATLVMFHAAELLSEALEAEAQTRRPSLLRKDAQERLEAMAKGIRGLGLQVETHVEDGIPSEAILHAIGSLNADLLVLGIHGVHRGIEHLLIGSNTEKILLRAECPVLTIGAHVRSGVDPDLHFKKILYFSDFTPEATAAAPYAMYFAKQFHAPVEVCQILPVVAENNEAFKTHLAENFGTHIKSALGDSNPEWCMPTFHLDRGMEIDEMLERAQSQNAGLIVLGVRTQSQLGLHLHTSFVYHLLARASCPVLSIRTSEARSREEGA